MTLTGISREKSHVKYGNRIRAQNQSTESEHRIRNAESEYTKSEYTKSEYLIQNTKSEYLIQNTKSENRIIHGPGYRIRTQNRRIWKNTLDMVKVLQILNSI